MHKVALFFEKTGKSPQRWRLRPQSPLLVGLWRLGAPPPDPPELLLSSPVTGIFLKTM